MAVDIGGTFTDVVAADVQTGEYDVVKVPTTPTRLVDAVREGTLAALRRIGAEPGSVVRFIHGTTVATNAVLEQSGARIGLLTTAGFEDILEIGRLKRSRMYDLMVDPQTPIFLAPRRRRRGIKERLAADGRVIEPLDETFARMVIEELLNVERVEAIAVCLLHSFTNDSHERRLRELIKTVRAEIPVSLSSDIDPTFREYERTVVTGFDAYLKPVVSGYVRDLTSELQTLGIQPHLQIMQSRGGIASADNVVNRPVSVLLSGPAAGTIGGKFSGKDSGFKDLITIDVGGTSADVSLIQNGEVLISTEGRIDIHPLRLPMVDVTTIGAGGGSLAWVDDAGGFRVGPQSAGSSPGPACYGRGGAQPTVTDASLVLGYLNSATLGGGTIDLDLEAAHRALESLGQRFGLSAIQAASGVHDVVNERMADAIRLVSVQRGHDPRQFALVALGGAGPVHAGRLAAKLAIPTVIVPPVPGVLSALGLLMANVEHDESQTILMRLDRVNPSILEDIFTDLEARVARRMAREGASGDDIATSRSGDLRYVGQGYTLSVPLPPRIDIQAIAACVTQFHAMHDQVHGHSSPSSPVELVSARVVQAWTQLQEGLQGPAKSRTSESASVRKAYFPELGAYVDTSVCSRSAVQEDDAIAGPAIIEQDDTTIVIYPGQRATVSNSGNLLISVPAEEL